MERLSLLLMDDSHQVLLEELLSLIDDRTEFLLDFSIIFVGFWHLVLSFPHHCLRAHKIISIHFNINLILARYLLR